MSSWDIYFLFEVTVWNNHFFWPVVNTFYFPIHLWQTVSVFCSACTLSTPPCKRLQAAPEKTNSFRNYGKSTASSPRRHAGKTPGLETAISHLHLDNMGVRTSVIITAVNPFSRVRCGFSKSDNTLNVNELLIICCLKIWLLFEEPNNSQQTLSPCHLHPPSFIHTHF